jgi:hypothetical protein
LAGKPIVVASFHAVAGLLMVSLISEIPTKTVTGTVSPFRSHAG